MDIRVCGSAESATVGESPPPAITQSDRLPQLDSLRGLAAFLVLVQHAQQTVPPISLPDVKLIQFGAWVLLEHTPLRIAEYGRGAVLFFFVLSGYVLTRALLRTGSPGVLAFAAQRTIRLLLPVAASVLLSLALYALVFDPAALPVLRERTLFTWWEPPTLGNTLANIFLVATDSEMRLNIPLWSLVHEWRLTLLLPLVLLFRQGPLTLLALCLVLMLAGQVGGAAEDRIQLGENLHRSAASTLYFALAIGTGCVLALTKPLSVKGARQQAVALTAIAVLFSMKSDLAIYAGSALLIIVAQEEGWLHRFLCRTPLVWLGRVSFSLYLVHAPVLVACVYALHDELPPVVVAVIGSASSLVVAALMRVAAEEPARRLARRVERRLSTRSPYGSGRDQRLTEPAPARP
jgi:peptidoglycan/LPS O-acetylase OafA/YrhL